MGFRRCRSCGTLRHGEQRCGVKVVERLDLRVWSCGGGCSCLEFLLSDTSISFRSCVLVVPRISS